MTRNFPASKILSQALAATPSLLASAAPPMNPASIRQPWYRILYVQVLASPWRWASRSAGASRRSASRWSRSAIGFIKLIKMMIAPIIFCTVVHGIASMSDLKKLGRVGVKTLIYFEVVSTLALVIGLVVVNWLQPGVGFHYRPPARAIAATAETFTAKAQSLSTVGFLLQHHSDHLLRRVRLRRPPAGAARLHAHRVRDFLHGRTRRARASRHRFQLGGLLRRACASW